MNKVREESTKARNEIQQRLFAKARTKLDTLLTAEQKAKLSKIKADIPDYMKRALGKTTTDDTDETPTAAWRPGANSWVPGMGAPMNLKNDMREAPRIREPRDGRRFPGSE